MSTRHVAVHTKEQGGVSVDTVPGGSHRSGQSVSRRSVWVPAPFSEHQSARTHTPGRTRLYDRTVCLVALSDLLSFPRQGVDTSWSSLLESSRALPGRGREGSLCRQKLRSTDTICLLLTRY